MSIGQIEFIIGLDLPHWVAQVANAVGRDAEASKAVILHVHVGTMDGGSSRVGESWLKTWEHFKYWMSSQCVCVCGRQKLFLMKISRS